MKKPLFLILFLSLTWNPQPSIAQNWDPQLLEVPRLAYEGSYKKAGVLAEQYIQAHPNDPKGYMVRAMVYDWERILTAKPSKPIKKKTVEFHKKANQLAFQRWHKNKNNVDALIDLGNSYIFLGRAYTDLGSTLRAVLTAKKGPKHLEKALEKDPNRVDGLLALGVFHYVADSTSKSLSALRGLLGIKGSKSEGLSELQKASSHTHPFQNDAIAALFYIHDEYEKNYPRALDYLIQLESQFPENPKWQTLRAEVYAKQDKAKGLKGYLDVLDWCRAKENRCIDKFYFVGYYHAGRLAKELGQDGQSKEYLSQALKVAPATESKSRANALVLLGEMEKKSGHLALALESYLKAKQVKGIGKKQKKSIQRSIKELCSIDPPPTKC